jgi:hypothetical protein
MTTTYASPALRRRAPLGASLALAALALASTGPVFAADPPADALYPRLDAYYARGDEYVRNVIVKSVEGAQRTCRGKLEAYLEVISFMAQMTNPRDFKRAPPDDPAVLERVANARATVEAEFAKRVREAIDGR